jgi:heptosyltransferase-1
MAPRILIVKLSSLGDVIHTLPAGQLLRGAFPDATIGWAVERAHAGILERQAWLDEPIVWERGTRRGLFNFLRRIRAGRWDVAIDFQSLLRSALVSRASGAQRVFGYSPAKECAHWLYHRRLPLATMERHAVDRSLELARRVIEQLGAQAPSYHSLSRPFPLTPSANDQSQVDEWLRRHRFRAGERLALLNPHCRKDANRWPAERFTELAKQLLDAGWRVALVGGGVAREVCDAIAAPLGERLWRADGAFGLLATAELIRRADAFVTGDTGPMHIAAGMGTPIVALFGPANPVRTGPYSELAQVIQRPLACSPCYARNACPLGHAVPPCMAEISVDEVFTAVQGALDRRQRRSA